MNKGEVFIVQPAVDKCSVLLVPWKKAMKKRKTKPTLPPSKILYQSTINGMILRVGIFLQILALLPS